MAETKRDTLTTRIFIGLLAGFASGLAIYYIGQFWPQSLVSQFLNDTVVAGFFHVIGQIFVNVLKLMIVPLVLVSLVCGVASTDEVRSLGRLGIKTFVLYLITTAIAVALALTVAELVQPGAGIALEEGQRFVVAEPPPLTQVLISIFPSNPVKAMAEGNMLQVIVFAILLGLAITHTGEHGQRVGKLFFDLNVVVMKMIQLIMSVAPYGVFVLVGKVFAEQGPDILLGLGKYVFCVLFALFLHVVLTYGSILRLLARLDPILFIRKMWLALISGFSTASSAATMPITMEIVEKKLGVKNSVASFTIPLGTTVNMDGTAIMQGVATVFIAGAYGVELGLAEFVTVILTATLASIGTAAVPSAGMITLAMVLGQVGLPAEAIGMILGVDRILDMTRTAVNITGDAAVTCAVARSENALNVDVFNDRRADTA